MEWPVLASLLSFVLCPSYFVLSPVTIFVVSIRQAALYTESGLPENSSR